MWNTMEQEVEHRRALLRLAAKGNAEARKELEQEYHASVYSPAQRAKYVPQVEQPAISAALQRTLDNLLGVELDPV